MPPLYIKAFLSNVDFELYTLSRCTSFIRKTPCYFYCIQSRFEKRPMLKERKHILSYQCRSLKDFNIPTESWEQVAQDRTRWRGLIKRGAGEYEAKRISEAEQKRAQRKARAKASPTELSSSDLSCSICNRQFRAKIGLISHLRTHR